MTKKEPANYATAAEIAADFGCSERQVRNFAAAGMPKAAHGKYDLLDCWRWYARKLRTDLEEAEKAVTLHSLEYEQTRETKARADIKEMEAARLRGELIPLEIYRQHVASHFTVVRQNILALAGQIAPLLEGLDRIEIKSRLHQKHRNILKALATGEEVINATSANGDGTLAEGRGADAGADRRTEENRSGTDRRARTAAGSKHKRVGRGKSGSKKRHK